MPTDRPRWSLLLRAPWLPLVLLLIIAAADIALHELSFTRSTTDVAAFGVLDWCGHLATAGLVLLTVLGGRFLAGHRAFTVSAMIGAVAIDLDHIALYAGVPGIAGDGGRPYTHSLLTAAALGGIWLVSGMRWTVFGGLAVGVALHFVRDIPTGNGVALFWPVVATADQVPYWTYAAAMIALAVAASMRALLSRNAAATVEPAQRDFSADRV